TDTRWIHIDAAQLDHVVAASPESFQAAEIDAERTASAQQSGDIVGIEADHGIDRILEQDGDADVAAPARVDRREAVGIQDLDQVRVLPDVETIMVGALGSDDSRIPDSIPVEGRRSRPGLGHRRMAIGGEVTRDHSDRYVAPRLQPLLAGDRGELENVVRETDDDGGAKPAHQLELLL